ncbi:hypothetical protein HNV12_05895 [Methanococcoides sp. SA1]|nr:hypothetical protein [Methanococcoides sp. SA1]
MKTITNLCVSFIVFAIVGIAVTAILMDRIFFSFFVGFPAGIFAGFATFLYLKWKSRVVVSKVDIAFDNIVDFLQNEVSLRFGKNKIEKDYQQDLEGKLSVLTERYGYDIKYESVKGKHRVDFVINGNIGIEMKVHRGGNRVNKELYNQIANYAPYCNKLIGLVVNETNDDTKILRMQIKDELKDQHAINANDSEIIVLDVKKRVY